MGENQDYTFWMVKGEGNMENNSKNESIRLQKYLALCGVASRRKCEDYIRQGKVAVNGVTVTEMGVQVSSVDRIVFDGNPVKPQSTKRYIMLNKPAGVVTTSSDPQGRVTAVSLVGDISQRIYPVGRLDYDTEGLLLLTNDGQLANRLTHPSYKVDKQYVAVVKGTVSHSDIARIQAGIPLADGHKSLPASARILDSANGRTTVELVVREGHNRLIRQMFEALDKKITFLKREKIGNISIGGLAVGRWRHLSPGEIKYLKQITGLHILERKSSKAGMQSGEIGES